MQGQIDRPIHLRIPLPEKDFGGAFVLEKSLVVASMPNGNYNLTVRIAEGDGGAVGCEDGKDTRVFDSCALTLFSVDVGVELTTVKEEEEADFLGQEGGGEREVFSDEDLLAIQQCRELGAGMTARTRPARIYDAISYRDEIEMLQVRVEEYGDLVSKIIVVEASRTHQGAARELVLPLHIRQLPAAMRQKILHIVVDFSDVPSVAESPDAWAREEHQRDAIVRGLEAASDEDIVLISDADEIPKRAAVLLLRVCQGYVVPAFLAAHMHYYGFHLAFADAWMQGPKVALRKMLHASVGATLIRRVLPLAPTGHMFNSSAWHCSYFVRQSDGSCLPLLKKFTTFSHTEFLGTNISDLGYIERMVRQGRDLFEEHHGIRLGGLSRSHAANCSQLPRRVQRLLSNYSHWTPHCIPTGEGVVEGSRGKREGVEVSQVTKSDVEEEGKGWEWGAKAEGHVAGERKISEYLLGNVQRAGEARASMRQCI